MRGRVSCSPPLLAGALTLALAGCVGSSRPSRFYTLAPSDVHPAATTTRAQAALAVGPVEIPDYVDRHQIVTRAGTNELVVADFERWAGSLREEITRSLVAVLADRLAPRNVAVAASRSPDLVPAASTYRAAVTITRFDGAVGESVVLRGRWSLFAERDGKAGSVTVREATITEEIHGAGYDALVAAMERALVRFGEQMADSVTAATQVAKVP
jgi:uncharacterized lipoprotein YmbA